MIKIEKVEVLGWEAAIRGMRNPMESHHLSDTKNCIDVDFPDCVSCPLSAENGCLGPGENPIIVGPNDHDLMMRLRNAGTDHRKYMRMITVYFDITAPMYWWKEFDTYKVGTVRNSYSTMHKIHAKKFTLEDFSYEHLIGKGIIPDHYEENPYDVMHLVIACLNTMREWYLETGNKTYWYQMIQLLPSSYNQKATIKLNYEVLANMYNSRKNHKLDEWRDFCKWIESLPYSEIITGEVT